MRHIVIIITHTTAQLAGKISVTASLISTILKFTTAYSQALHYVTAIKSNCSQVLSGCL